MKKILILICVLLTFYMVFSKFMSKKHFEHELSATCLITNENHSSGGTGFIVRSERSGDSYKNVMVTCGHIAGNKPSIVLVPVYKNHKLHRYLDYPATFSAVSNQEDLAIMIFESSRPLPTVKLDFTTQYRIGDEVYRTGYGSMDDCRLEKGFINSISIRRPSRFVNHIRANLHTIWGDSGGPVFLENKKIIGVTSAIRVAQNARTEVALTNQTFIAPIDGLKVWNERTNNSLEFVYNSNIQLPTLPFFENKLNQMNIINQ